MAVYGVARLGKARLNAFRLNYYQPWVKVVLAGVVRTSLFRIEGCTVTQALNHEPDTLNIRTVINPGITPAKGQEFKLYVGDTDLVHQLFGGRILNLETLYEDKDSNILYDLSCIDYTWLLNRRKVTKRYTNQSATTIILDLVPSFSSGFTTNHVEADLPTVDEITFTNEDLSDAISRVMERIGGYWYADYGLDIHAFLNEGETAGSIVDGSTRTARDLVQSEDLSQAITLARIRGGGSNAASDVEVGSATLPLEDGSWYDAAGGTVECGPQRIAYTGLAGTSGEGAVVGTGNAPTNQVTAAHAHGTNLAAGSSYDYAVTYVTASGETLPGPRRTFTPSGGSATAPGAPSAQDSGLGGGAMVNGGSYRWRLAKVLQGGGIAPGSASIAYTVNSNKWQVFVDPALLTSDPKVTVINIYRTTNGGGTYYGEGSTSTGGWVTVGEINDGDLALGPTIPASNNTDLRSGYLTNIPTSPSASVTQRKVYRTAAGGGQLKLLTTLANNTTTVYHDTTADGALGANAPTTDTSGLTNVGQVNAGSTTLPLSDTAPFASGGGWLAAGNQVLRYTGKTATAVTGIPASGVGALTSTLSYGTDVLLVPHLTGIAASGAGSIQYAITKGDQVNVLVERNDTTAQTNMASFVGGDGIHEGFEADGRLSIAECEARGDALLALNKDPIVTARYATRDQTQQPGRAVTINVTNPPVNGTFKIQRVTITQIGIDGGEPATAHVFPMRQVEASSRRFSFEDLLRQFRGRL